MPSCIVKGCNFSWKKKDPNIILHSFPGDLGVIKSWLLAAAQATKQEFGNIDELCRKILVGKSMGLYRMCSQHFTGDCYYQRGMLISLKKEALPTIFPDKEAIQLKASRPKTYKPRQKIAPPPYPSPVNGGRGGVPTVMGLPLRVVKLEQTEPVPPPNPCLISEHGYYVNRGDVYAQRRPWNANQSGRSRTLGTNTEYFPGQRHKATLTDKNAGKRHKEVQTEQSADHWRPCRCKQEEETRLTSCLHAGLRTAADRPILTAAESLPAKGGTLELPQYQPSGIGLLSNVNSVPNVLVSRSREAAGVRDVGCSLWWPDVKEENPFGAPVSGDPNIDHKRQGSSYSSMKREFGTNEEQSGDPDMEDVDLVKVEIPGTSASSDPVSENKYVVFDSCLNKLLMRCRCLADDGCDGCIVKIKKFFVGSSVSVKAECSNGHRFHMWDSQP
ncbi:uncharacterized protein ACMZJ9_015431 [Mantella aurantiaca]